MGLRIASTALVLSPMFSIACASQHSSSISSATLERISECSAGYSFAASDKEFIALERHSIGLVLSSAQMSSLRGSFLESLDLSDKSGIEVFKSYLSCISFQKSSDDLIQLVNSNAYTISVELINLDRADQAEELIEIIDSWSSLQEKGDFIAAREKMKSAYAFVANLEQLILFEDGVSMNFALSKDGVAGNCNKVKDLFSQQECRRRVEEAAAEELKERMTRCIARARSLAGEYYGFPVEKICERERESQIIRHQIEKDLDPCKVARTIEQQNECFYSLLNPNSYMESEK